MAEVVMGSGPVKGQAPPSRWAQLKATLGAWGFMGPAAVLVLVFFFLPVIILFVISLTDLSSSNFSEPLTFVGLENFTRLFKDKFFPKIMGNTFFYVATTLICFNAGMALVLALLTTHINRRAGFFFRLIWLLPRITPSVIYILMWRRISHQPPFGLINQLLAPFGVEPQYWLFEQPWLFVILANGFVGASFGLILFSSAIEAIPKDFITAAKVDGARHHPAPDPVALAVRDHLPDPLVAHFLRVHLAADRRRAGPVPHRGVGPHGVQAGAENLFWPQPVGLRRGLGLCPGDHRHRDVHHLPARLPLQRTGAGTQD
jgi:ABC-type spermidine/putrescine transport system permease subunit I